MVKECTELTHGGSAPTAQNKAEIETFNNKSVRSLSQICQYPGALYELPDRLFSEYS